jgi:hypothetical protein
LVIRASIAASTAANVASAVELDEDDRDEDEHAGASVVSSTAQNATAPAAIRRGFTRIS